MKISVVITVFNEEKKIEDCLKSVKAIASEIIVIDNNSSDATLNIAKRYTNRVYSQENDPLNIDFQKNFGFEKATDKWILSLDADERVTQELSHEIEALEENSDINGYEISRKNIIFGKWIEHTGWYPDYGIRLFRKGKGKFAKEKVHKDIQIEGMILRLNNPILHYNYDNLQSFLQKMIFLYTIPEAENKLKNGYKYNPLDIVKMPLSEFIKRYFAEEGFKDGMHGLVLSLLMSFYHFIVFLRLWEASKYPNDDVNKIVITGKKMIVHEFGYWKYQTKIKDERNIFKKQIYKVKRKIIS